MPWLLGTGEGWRGLCSQLEAGSECVGGERRKEGFQKEGPNLDLDTLTVRRNSERRDGAVPRLLRALAASLPEGDLEQ